MRSRTEAAALGPFFGLVTFWYAVEYLRPQDYVTALEVIRPALILMVILFAIWLARGDKSMLGDGLVRGFIAFIIAGLLSVPFAVNTYWAFFNNVSLITFLLAGVLPFIAFIERPAALRRFFNWWVFFMAIVAVTSALRGGRGSGSFMGDENDLALTLAVALPFAYFLGTDGTRERWVKVLFVIAAIAMVAGIVVTRSRGGFLGLMMAALAVVWFSRNRVRNTVVVILFGILSAISISQFDLLAPQIDPNNPSASARPTPSYLDEMSTISDAADATRVTRIYYWKRCWEMFLDHPILGVGPGNFGWRVEEYELADAHRNPSAALSGGRAAHSLYFTLLAEYGLVGTTLYVMLSIGLWSRMKRVRRRLAGLKGDDAEVLTALARAASASLIAFFVSGAFLTVLYYPHFWYLLGFAIALDRVSVKLAPEPERTAPFGRGRVDAPSRA